MFDLFRSIVQSLIQLANQNDPYLLRHAPKFFSNVEQDPHDTYRAINAAFLIVMGGEGQPAYQEANDFLERVATSPDWQETAVFFADGLNLIKEEISTACKKNPDIAQQIRSLSSWLADQESLEDISRTTAKFWSLFHPEATNIWSHEEQRVEALRNKRKISIIHLNKTPIRNPSRQILFTANALLTPPPDSTSLEKLTLSETVKQEIPAIFGDPQLYWYDHPIQIGVDSRKNEVLYGLRGLQRALDFKRAHNEYAPTEKLNCVLSVSVTHARLQGIARQYLIEEITSHGPNPDLNVFLFTEKDTSQIIEEILVPAAKHYLGNVHAKDLLKVLGVDGEYARHYTFLKAIAAFWQVLIDPQIKATFKIDLDQIFPQKELVEETGLGAFENFKTPLWGAKGLDADGDPVEMGMIAGALVNEGDIPRSLYTPDVPFPSSETNLSLDEHIFFSQLPQALSTQAEMMARYNTRNLDGRQACLQRVHVTGGTTGILVDSLRRYRPFTPSFIGRAEDQAFILSTFQNVGEKLTYLHKDGLIMRHDKEAFAQEAIQAAQIGKLVGDYVRILYFSAYARALNPDIKMIKERVDPFTGSFISHIPITLTYLRFAMKAEDLFRAGEAQLGSDFIKQGARRIRQAVQFAFNDEGYQLKERYEHERSGWWLYYDTLTAIEGGLQAGDPFAMELRIKAQDLISGLSTH